MYTLYLIFYDWAWLFFTQEAAHILGQIASLACSRQSRPQTLNFTEIQSRIEKEVTTRVASHVDSLRFEMEERMQAMNAKQERMQAEMNAKEERMQAEMRKMRQMLEDFLRTWKIAAETNSWVRFMVTKM